MSLLDKFFKRAPQKKEESAGHAPNMSTAWFERNAAASATGCRERAGFGTKLLKTREEGREKIIF